MPCGQIGKETVGSLLGTNISSPKGTFEDEFLFPFGGICIHSLEGSYLT